MQAAQVAGLDLVAARGLRSGSRRSAMGQRGWNTQPDGGLSGLGTSPPQHHALAPRLDAGSGMGTAESSACV